MDKSNLGRISVNFADLLDNPDKYAGLFAGIKFLAHKITISPFTGRIEYTGYSKKFDLVDVDSIPPSYELLDSGIERKTISFIKRD